MNFDFANLFGTPVWSAKVPDAEAFNAELMQAGSLFKPRTNYFSIQHPAIARLKQIVHEQAEVIGKQYGWRYPIEYIKGRQNPIGHGQSDSPHHHGVAKLVGVYYVNAKPGQGDILLHDPRGGTDWPDPQAVTDPGKSLRAFHRITPESGMLILHPGFLVHSVEHNPTQEVRVSIAIEVYTKLPSESDYLG